MKIERERWLQAQTQEIHHAIYDLNQLEQSINYYFNYFGDTHKIHGLKVAEIGCSTFPMASFFPDMQITGVDPLFNQFNDQVKFYWKTHQITAVSEAFEDWKTDEQFDEVWFINCLQHVIDPDLCLIKAKSLGKRVRVFEPINWPVDNMHPHTFTIDYFKNFFPDSDIKFYQGGTIPAFHFADCAYFVS